MLSKCVKVRILLFPPQIPLVPREYKYIGAINFNNEVSVIEYYGDVRTIDLSNYDKEHTLPVYRKLTDKDARYLVLMGGGGSGKSHYISRLIPRRTLGSDEPMKTLVIRNVKEDNRNSTFAELKSAITEMGIEEFFKINKSTMDIECTRNGNSIIFRGLDDIDRVKSIAGITQIWVEEASEISEEAFNQLDIRLRNERETYENQIIVTFNPISNKHWLKKRFFDKKDPRAHTLITTYHDNPYLPQDVVDVLEGYKTHSPYYYRVYCLAEWGTVGETVFNRELLGKRMDEIFTKKFKQGRFEFEYVDQMIIPSTIKWADDPKGAITLYTEPEDTMPYVVGADTAGIGIDYFAALVVNNYTDAIVAQYHSDKATEKEFSDQLYCLGMWYNEAMVNVETNYSTYPVLELARMEYPTLYKREAIGTNDGSRAENRYGFITNKSTRNTILSLVDSYVKDNINEINSYELLEELSSFVIIETRPPRGKVKMRQEAAQGSHDDLIMAFGITLFTQNQWEKEPKMDRKPDWKQQYDPLDMYLVEEEGYSIW